MRADVQTIFKMTPHEKQVMMFSATLSAEIRPICKKFMSDVGLPNAEQSAAYRCSNNFQVSNLCSNHYLDLSQYRVASGCAWISAPLLVVAPRYLAVA